MLTVIGHTMPVAAQPAGASVPGGAVEQPEQPAQLGCDTQNEWQQSCSLTRPPVALQSANAAVLVESTQVFFRKQARYWADALPASSSSAGINITVFNCYAVPR
jgi:invasion protein IalB